MTQPFESDNPSAPDTMRAALYTRYGPPEVLHVGDVPTPKPGAREILIRVHAAEVTKGDCELRSFRFPVKWFSAPLRLLFGITRPRKPILGGYFAGTVVAVGARVSRFQPGDEILGAARLKMGCHAEYVCLPEHYSLARKPANVSFEQAAAIPLGGLNAYHFMSRAGLQEGGRILINGAGGSIGTFAIQLARNAGAQVTAVDSAEKEALLRGLGAQAFIDYREQDFTQSGNTWDVVFDMVASTDLHRCLKAVSPGGCYITANPTFKKMTSARKVEKTTGKKIVFAFAGETQQELEALCQMAENELIAPAVDRVFPLTDVVAAHRCVEHEQRLGIVVVTP